jgi:hypothetical protein
MSTEDQKIVSGINISRKFISPKGKNSRVLRAEELPPTDPDERRVQVVGGDAEDVDGTPPTIIIEKDHDRIARIIVKCPCGRHSELRCEYEDQDDTPPSATP